MMRHRYFLAACPAAKNNLLRRLVLRHFLAACPAAKDNRTYLEGCGIFS